MKALMAQLELISLLSSQEDGWLTSWHERTLPRVWWVVSSSHITLKENSEVRPLLKVGQQVAVKAQSWSLAYGPLSMLYGDLREIGSWLIEFQPWLTQRGLREGGLRCAHGLDLDGDPLEMVLWLGFYFAPKGGFRKANDRCKVKNWNLKSLNQKPSDDWDFSQRRGHFAAKAHFCNKGPFSQLRNEGLRLQNGTRVPKVGFAAAK